MIKYGNVLLFSRFGHNCLNFFSLALLSLQRRVKQMLKETYEKKNYENENIHNT